jgi:hypothetical protein
VQEFDALPPSSMEQHLHVSRHGDDFPQDFSTSIKLIFVISQVLHQIDCPSICCAVSKAESFEPDLQIAIKGYYHKVNT